MTLKSISKNTVEIVKSAGKDYMADTPKWAKVVRLIGLVVGAAGGTILTSNPVMWPVAVIAAAPYMTMIGNFTALLVQSFKK